MKRAKRLRKTKVKSILTQVLDTDQKRRDGINMSAVFLVPVHSSKLSLLLRPFLVEMIVSPALLSDIMGFKK